MALPRLLIILVLHHILIVLMISVLVASQQVLRQGATQVAIVVDGARHLAAKLANLTEQQLAVELMGKRAKT